MMSERYIDHPELYTDFYQLTMMQAYFLQDLHLQHASFDYFFRSNPFGGGYTIFSGLGVLLDTVEGMVFSADSLAYLQAQGFNQKFIDYLKDFSFAATIDAVREGEVVFPGEPVICVSGTLLECILVETLLLNIVNFQTLISTKAARIKALVGTRRLYDFGLRRAQGLAGIHASRAAIIGGCDATSNVYAAKRYGIPAVGTMSHAWVQSFASELDAFSAFAMSYPNACVLLVDTYNTLQSGVPNAITVAQELRQQGHELKAIRLDSGDLAYIAQKARGQLDAAGFPEVKIAVSNQLDEDIISSLLQQHAPIDIFGVGTRLVTGAPDSALDGVYKLAHCQGKDTIKVSDNVEKTSLPGRKKILRCFYDAGDFFGDVIALTSEDDLAISTMYHPNIAIKHCAIDSLKKDVLLGCVMQDGKRLLPKVTPQDIAAWSLKRREQLDASYQRLHNPHVYKVGLSKSLLHLRNDLMREHA